MMFQRESGVLLHPTSLPGRFGIGDLGPEALRWIRWLHGADQRLWQVLPLSPVGPGLSPYTCSSSFAGNPLLLSPERLADAGHLSSDELKAAELPSGPVNEAAVMSRKPPLIEAATQRFVASMTPDDRDAFGDYCAKQAYWLVDYARYQACKTLHRGAPWWSWPKPLRAREPSALAALDQQLTTPIEWVKAQQFLFEQQWQSVRRLANLKRIRLIGDLPIFVSLDSADVWSHQHLFQLHADGSPIVVAGVPPDYFAKDGQRWGNPLYDWKAHEAEDFAWWSSRVQRTLELCDILRIDHFRGFAACWEIPAQEPTAVHGRWAPAPGRQLFESVQRRLGELPVIAEDLGLITDDVVALREHFGFPTMRVMQFSFGGDKRLLPHNFPRNSVAYTGTHDNDTTVGWYSSPVEEHGLGTKQQVQAERDRFRRYYTTDGADVQWTAIQRLMAGQAAAVIFPLQDIIGLGSEARMNTPGTVGPHNWTWRFSSDQLDDKMQSTLRAITHETHRNAT